MYSIAKAKLYNFFLITPSGNDEAVSIIASETQQSQIIKIIVQTFTPSGNEQARYITTKYNNETPNHTNHLITQIIVQTNILTGNDDDVESITK